MKKVNKLLAVILSVILGFQMYSLSVKAAEKVGNSVVTLSETRTATRKNGLKEIYHQLFPEAYHYIEEYEMSGVQEMNADQIELIFYGSKDFEGTTYDLTVMSNGQIFISYVEDIRDGIAPQDITTYKKQKFTTGDLDHYTYFYITYTIDTRNYDKIISCDDVQGWGFYLYPTNLSKKMVEDAEGPAHYGYNNVSMNYDGSGVLYDIGVGVGNNKAKAITQVSTGADMWLWAFIYAFFFSD